MDQWEYATLSTFLDRRGGGYLVWRPTGGAAEQLTAESLYGALAKVGKEGWEMVAASTSASSETLYFKRRLDA